ncbi:MAG: hypothetical protein GTN49_07495 [candidate division Zixibacteria bacterium]|nr:hypothetical protein [candidate division Zixibacteria bacterium]
MLRKVFILVGVSVAACIAAPAFGGVGSVISSFPWSEARNIYRDGNYVYCVAGANALRRYTVGGSLLGTVTLSRLTAPADADHTPTGPGYLGVIEQSNRLFEYRVANGSFVRSVATGPITLGYAYFPGSTYVYLHRGTYSNIVYRCTTAGSVVSSFPVSSSAGTIAATNRFNDVAGDYVVVGSRVALSASVYTGTGSFVRSFVMPAVTYGCVCGPGAPSARGTTYWCNLRMGVERFAYQIDLGNATAVAPASVGRIKALFR